LEFPEDFSVTTITHPNTYLNKILFGSNEGTLQLWNIKSMELIYKFKGWGSSIICVQQSPAIDVIAIGLSDGNIIIHNIKFDKTIITFKQDEGMVTSLSFRSGIINNFLNYNLYSFN
jgi:U3 small nucleolar RNA-associated protein 21